MLWPLHANAAEPLCRRIPLRRKHRGKWRRPRLEPRAGRSCSRQASLSSARSLLAEFSQPHCTRKFECSAQWTRRRQVVVYSRLSRPNAFLRQVHQSDVGPRHRRRTPTLSGIDQSEQMFPRYRLCIHFSPRHQAALATRRWRIGAATFRSLAQSLMQRSIADSRAS